MMVPTTRLLTMTGLLGMPALGLAVMLAPGMAAGVCAGVFLALACLAAFDAWRGRLALAGFEFRPAGVVRLAAGRQGVVALVLELPPNTACRQIRAGLPLPSSFQADRDLRVELPKGAEAARLVWSCTPGLRGLFRVEACALERESPLGFWAVRRKAPLALDLRVYPSLLAERRAAPALFMRQGLFGIRQERRLGKGRDFEKLRDYMPGDSYGDIHWKATARRGRPVTKVFQVESTQEVYVALDASRLSGRLSSAEHAVAQKDGALCRETMLERYIGAALVLARAAQRQGDRFGLLVADNDVRRFLPAGRGVAHYRACLDALFTVQPSDAAPDFNELFAWIAQRLTRRSLIVFLTQLDDPALAETFVRGVSIVRRRHLLLVAMPAPSAICPVFSTAAPVETVDDVYAGLAGHLRWQSIQALRGALGRQGVRFDTVTESGLCLHLVNQYMKIKQRQGL